jgi:hypothetical protein
MPFNIIYSISYQYYQHVYWQTIIVDQILLAKNGRNYSSFDR